MAEISEVRSAFIEKIGFIAQGEGMPRIAGRVFGLLLFDGEERSFGELSTELGVSRGSISSSVRLLEDRSLIKRVGKPGDRQEYFRLADNPYIGLLDGAKARASRAGDEIDASIDILPNTATDIRNRLAQYARFYRSIEGGLEHALTDLNRVPTQPVSARRSKT